jgi:hypothetical protein
MFLKKNNLVTKFQSGCRPGDSTVIQLISISIDFGKAIEDENEIRILFFDISEAFDRVWHKGLLYKLKSIGIDNTVLKWFGSCLSNRRHKR